ncbi:MAG: hypothetical protein AB1757_06855 [Acidobacteriota bacterium]
MKLEEIFVSKLVSENEGGDSNQYEYIGLSRAINKYGQYCRNFEHFYRSPKLNMPERSELKFKTFDEWLLTEI